MAAERNHIEPELAARYRDLLWELLSLSTLVLLRGTFQELADRELILPATAGQLRNLVEGLTKTTEVALDLLAGELCDESVKPL